MSRIEKLVKKIAKLEAKLKKQREKLREEGVTVMSADDYHSAKKAYRRPGYVGNEVNPRVVYEHITPTDYEALHCRSRELFEDYQDQQLQEMLSPYGKKKPKRS